MRRGNRKLFTNIPYPSRIPLTTNPKSFTLAHDGIAKVLVTDAHIGAPSKPGIQPPIGRKYRAIWDTGATSTVITRKVVDECSLKPIGMTQSHTAGGKIDNCPVYLVSVFLPNFVVFHNLRVVEGQINDNENILIGMDIICNGDFAITHHNGKTKFTYRYPSVESIDFVVAGDPVQQLPHKTKIGRNEKCPCGSGKKYKNCCGKLT